MTEYQEITEVVDRRCPKKQAVLEEALAKHPNLLPLVGVIEFTAEEAGLSQSALLDLLTRRTITDLETSKKITPLEWLSVGCDPEVVQELVWRQATS